MRDYDQAQEAAFFALVQEYYDLERNTARQFGQGEYTLERMDQLAGLAAHPERRLQIVHVAGTKGKGSTCFYIAALLEAAGRNCGVYTSPHLATVRERFLIRGEPVTYDVLLNATREYDAKLRATGLKPTLFEIMTVVGLQLFAQAGCDYVILETGIGGLLDATNFVPAPRCCALTSISFDHTQLLGNSIAEIASQKAGIIKTGVPVVCARQPFAAAEEVIRNTAAAKGAPLHAPCAASEVEPFLGTGDPLPPFLRENLQTARRVVQLLGENPDPARFNLPRPRARCEVIRRAPLVVLDAAHNADSAQRLAQCLPLLFPGVAFTIVLGVAAGKDADGIFAALKPVAAAFVLTNPESAVKGSELPRLTELARATGVPYRVIPALQTATDLPATVPLLFTGSFFTALIGERLFDA